MNELKQLYTTLRQVYTEPERIGEHDDSELPTDYHCGYCVGGAVLNFFSDLWDGEHNDYTEWYTQHYTEQWLGNNSNFPQDSDLAWGLRYIYKELTKGEIELDVSFANWLANKITQYNDDGEFGQAWDIVHTLFNRDEFKQIELEWKELRNQFKDTGVL